MQLPNSQNPWPPMQPQGREPRRYGALAALVLSFFSPEFYRDVGKRWRGIGFWYLVFLMLLTAIPYGIQTQIRFPKFVKEDARPVISTFPSLTLKHGKVSSVPDPYLWIEPSSGVVLLYVDTTGDFDDARGQNAVVKLSDSKLTVRKSPTETDVHDLSQMPDFTVDKHDLAKWSDVAMQWAGLVAFGVVFIGPLIGHIFVVLIYGVIALLFCLMFDTKLSYGALVRLAVVALTPAMLIDAAVCMAWVHVPQSGWMYFAMDMLFLLVAVKANAGQSTPTSGFPVGYGPPIDPHFPPPPPGYGPPPHGYMPPGQYPPR